MSGMGTWPFGDAWPDSDYEAQERQQAFERDNERWFRDPANRRALADLHAARMEIEQSYTDATFGCDLDDIWRHAKREWLDARKEKKNV